MVAVVLASALPGCPLSDEYFVDPNAGIPGLGSGAGGASTASGGAAGAGATAGSSVVGGSSGAAADGGGAGTMGLGGASGAGATGGSGGGSGGSTGGSDNAGGAPEAGATGEAGSGGSAGSGCVRETELCDGIDNDCDDSVDEGSVCPDSCTARRSPSDGHLYLLCISTDPDDAIAGDDASARCGDIGTELGLELPFGLVWLESSEENELVKEWIVDAAPSDAVVWIGANDEAEENIWVWGRRTGAVQFFTGDSSGGGTPYMDRFNDWGSGQPDAQDGSSADCAAFDSAVGWHWNDRSCAREEVGYMCEEHPPF